MSNFFDRLDAKLDSAVFDLICIGILLVAAGMLARDMFFPKRSA